MPFNDATFFRLTGESSSTWRCGVEISGSFCAGPASSAAEPVYPAPTIPCVESGVSLHDNLAELEATGLTRFQALSTATRIPGDFIARNLGGPRFGVIELGARADLFVSTSNPLDDLATLREPVGVMIEGRWHDSAALGTILNEVKDTYGSSRQHDPASPGHLGCLSGAVGKSPLTGTGSYFRGDRQQSGRLGQSSMGEDASMKKLIVQQLATRRGLPSAFPLRRAGV